jgi:hypothetical protein
MNATIQAIRKVDADNSRKAEAEIDLALAMENQRSVRESGQDHKNKQFASHLRALIDEADKDIETLLDMREVKVSDIASKADTAIAASSKLIADLAHQLSEAQSMLKKQEAAKLRLTTEARDYYTKQIASAQSRKAICERDLADLAKPAE